MSIYLRNNIWWFRFKFGGRRIQESTKTANEELARKIERKRHRELETSINGIKHRTKALMVFSVHAKQYLKINEPHWSDSNRRIEGYNVDHLLKSFAKSLLTDIEANDISLYQAKRKNAGASNRTINMEVGSLRAILKKERLWANLQPDVKMLKARSDVGRALSRDEETRVLTACRASRSRSLYPAVLLSSHTGLRNKELRLLRWKQVDLLEHEVIVGKSKTAGGEGRKVPMSDTAWRAMKEWRSQWPNAKPEHFVFPSERYGFAGGDGPQKGTLQPYGLRTDVPMGSWKVAWSNALEAAGVKCRWHDLRHTFVSRIAEGQVSDATIMALAGHLSVKMKEKYSHTRTEAKRQAVAMLDMPVSVQ